MPVCIRRRALDVPRVADGDQHLRVGDQVFQLDFIDLVDDLRAAIVPVRFVHFAQLADDDLLEFFVAGENFLQLGDEFADGLQFLENFIDRELREAVQLQFENRIDLQITQPRIGGQSVLFAIQNDSRDFLAGAVLRNRDGCVRKILEQVFLGVHAAGLSTNNPDHVVEVIQGNLIAEQNVLALFRFFQLENRAAADYIDAVLDEQLDHRDQAQFARLPGDDGEQDHAERLLHLRELEKIIEDELRFFAALQLDDDAHAFARGFIAHIGNSFQFFRLHQFGDALDQPRLVHLIRNLRDDDAFAVFGGLFDSSLGAHGKAAAACFVSGFDAFAARDVRPGWKIWPRHNLHYFFQRCVGLFDQKNCRVHNFAQIVGREVSGHAAGNAARAVDEQIRYARREHHGFFARLIEV